MKKIIDSKFKGMMTFCYVIRLFFAVYFDPATHFDQTVNKIQSRHFQEEKNKKK